MTGRDVPAWMGHLRTDRRGLPVPYVNLWGREDQARFEIRDDPHVGQPAIYIDDAYENEPDFTHQNMQRQRECMMRGLCQVCATGLPAGRRYLAIADLSVGHIDVDGTPAIAVTEPWLCRACARFAAITCPALIRRTRSEHLTVVKPPPGSYQLVVSTGWVDGPLERQSKRIQPAMWVKIVLLDPAVNVGWPR